MNRVIPKSWKIFSLKDICFFQEGPGLRNWQYCIEGVKFINIRCIHNGNIDLSNAQHLNKLEVEKKYQHFLLDEGDYVMSSSGTIGRVAIVKKHYLPLLLNTSVIRFRTIDEKNLDSFFLLHFLQSKQFLDKISEQSQGSAQVNFGPTHLKLLDVLLPPLPEQKKISSILTSVDEVIEKTQKQIDKLQDFKKATMNELLTKGIGHTEFKDSELGRIPKSWKCMKTKQLLDFKNGLNKEKEAFGSGQKIVNYMDVFSNTEINAKKIKGRVELNNSEINRFEVRDGDVFFTRTSETPDEVGLSSVILNLDETYCFSGFILRGRQLENILYPPLSGIFFRTDYIRKQIIKTCTYTTRALTNGNSLGRINIAVPSIKEQILIYKHIGSISNKIIKTKKIIKKYELLKKSLMQDLLTGKVRVRVN